MEFNQESNDEQNSNEEMTSEEDNQSSGAKQWFQDNLRIIVSIFIVVVIAAGIYSYSNRSQNVAQTDQSEQSDILKDLTKSEDQSATQANGEDKAGKVSDTSSVTTSQETDQSFVETAGKGDGTTKLARKALANYLEKNPDSSLTPEHKIYIEDYLRKNINHKGGVSIGTSVEFSKSLIADAISKSKNLTAGQLKNLHKYAVRVPSLT
jgi:flagellar basal body-associated protein FliL